MILLTLKFRKKFDRSIKCIVPLLFYVLTAWRKSWELLQKSITNLKEITPVAAIKLNSAIAQAYYAKKQGLKGVTTETGAGQSGTALSMACSYFNA